MWRPDNKFIDYLVQKSTESGAIDQNLGFFDDLPKITPRQILELMRSYEYIFPLTQTGNFLRGIYEAGLKEEKEEFEKYLKQ